MTRTLPIAAAMIAATLFAVEPQARPISWADLDSGFSGEAGRTAGAAARPGMAGSRVVDRADIELSGFLLPIDREGDLVYEFLLVSAPGACSHAAPPPPKQIVHVLPAEPFRIDQIYQPVSVKGMLSPETELLQLFVLDGVRTIETGYRLSRASVTGARAVPMRPSAGANPWTFLKKR